MNKNLICAKCGKNILSYCFNPECVEWRAQVVQEAIKDYFATLDSLNEKITQENVAGSVEDYKKIKNVEKEIKNLGNFEEPIKGEIERLKKYCLDLISNYFSPKVKRIGDSKRGIAVIHSICCLPKNLNWMKRTTNFIAITAEKMKALASLNL